MSRKPGERNWDDPVGYPIPIKDVPEQKISDMQRAGYRVTDQGTGWFAVTDGEHEWNVSLSCDNILSVEDRSYPNKRCDPAVLKAVARIM